MNPKRHLYNAGNIDITWFQFVLLILKEET